MEKSIQKCRLNSANLKLSSLKADTV